MKKFTKMFMALGTSVLLAACSDLPSDAINMVTREEGSGTRDAFTEITGVTQNDDDMTTPAAIHYNSTDGVLSYVADDPFSIGYVSLGSLNDSVKALKVEGVEATEANVAAGNYKVQRPFNIITKKDKGLSDVAQDFLDFILSKQGQQIVSESGYVPLDVDDEYQPSGMTGTVKISGSTSVGPVVESLAEEYQKLNPDIKGIEINQNGSGAGIQAASNGSSDFGMASRELKDNEKDVEATVIARDGIAVIVNKENPVDDITLNVLKDIYTGKTNSWETVKQILNN